MMSRCQYSEYGLRTLHPRSGQRKGVLIRTVRWGQCVLVRWDGNETATPFHKDFIEVISEPVATRTLVTIREPGRLAWYGWKSPLPSYVTAGESLWVLWRQNFLAECE